MRKSQKKFKKRRQKMNFNPPVAFFVVDSRLLSRSINNLSRIYFPISYHNYHISGSYGSVSYAVFTSFIDSVLLEINIISFKRLKSCFPIPYFNFWMDKKCSNYQVDVEVGLKVQYLWGR